MLARIILLLFFCLVPPANADVALNGFIIDRTYTRFGKEFYREYTQRISGARFDFNITVEEKFLPRVGSLIRVLADRQAIYAQILGRKNSEMKAHVDQAINATSGFIARRLVPEINPDLQGDGYR